MFTPGQLKALFVGDPGMDLFRGALVSNDILSDFLKGKFLSLRRVPRIGLILSNPAYVHPV